MRKINGLFADVVLLATLFGGYSHTAMAVSAGQIEFVVGGVVAQGADGLMRPLAKGAQIETGDTIQTGDGRAQLRFSDGGYISLSPGTTFRVDEYHYAGKSDGSEKGFFSLVKGGLRAITGAIGHVNKQTYRVKTPTATIGIRGTEFLAQMDDKLVVKVGEGAVYLSNSAGDLMLYKGQSGEVESENQKPKYSNETPVVNAAGPKGATPKERQGRDSREGYVAGENVNDTDSACRVAGICQSTPTSTTQTGIALLTHTNWAGTGNSFSSTPDIGLSVTKDGAGSITSISGPSWSATAQSDVMIDSVGSINMGGSYGTLNWGRWTGGHVQVADTSTRTVALTALHVVVGQKTPASELNSLAASGLIGRYSVVYNTTPTLTNTMTGATSNVAGAVAGALTVNFGTGFVNLNLNAGGYSTTGAGGTVSYAGSTFTVGGPWSGGAGGAGMFSAVGLLAGPNAALAGVSYKFFDVNSDITGVAIFNQDTLGPI